MKANSAFSAAVVALAAILLLSAGCSIQSRRYTRGYYVKWHRKAAKGDPVQNIRGGKDPGVVVCSAIARKSLPEDNRQNLIVTKVNRSVIVDRPVSIRLLPASSKVLSEAELAQARVSGERKADWVGLAAFAVSVGAWFTASYLMLPLSLLAVALSLISLNRMGKAPEKYVLKTLSLVALILSVAGAALSMYSLILLIFS